MALWLLRAFALAALLVAAGTFIPRPLWPSVHAAGPSTTVRSLLVLSNPIHTDIGIPLDDTIRARFGFLTEAGVPVDNPGAKYLIIGWGGRSFYLETPHWADIKPLPVFKAFTIDRSVLHVDVAGNLRENDPAVTHLQANDAGMERMLGFIEASFTRDNGKPLPILDTRYSRYSRYDAFYEANGFFNALLGCNTWTARALREAGIRTGTWNPVPQTLAVSLKLYN